MQSTYVDGPKTYIAGEDLEAYRRVKIESGTVTDPPEVVYADAGEDCIGITLKPAKDTEPIAVQGLAKDGTFLACAADSFARGATLYGAADGKVSDTASGTSYFVALGAAGANLDIVEIAVHPFLATAAGSVSIVDSGSKFAGSTVEAALQECAAAATVDIADAGTFTDATTVEAALQEIYQALLTAQGIIPIPMPVITDAGAALAAFSDGDSTVPGYCVTAKGLGIRWNNHATPGAVGTKVMVPPDMDVAADAVLHILAAKVGATVGDAVKFTVAAYNNDVGAAYDADSTFGGDTTAMTGDATTKFVQEVTLTLALANLTAYPAAIELTIKPKDGTLGTDDVIMLAAWIEYQKKLLTA